MPTVDYVDPNLFFHRLTPSVACHAAASPAAYASVFPSSSHALVFVAPTASRTFADNGAHAPDWPEPPMCFHCVIDQSISLNTRESYDAD